MAAAEGELRAVAGRFPEHVEIQLTLAKGAYNAINHYGAQQRWQEMAAAEGELRAVAGRFSNNIAVQEVYARELFNEIIGYRRSDTLASSEKTREALRQLARNFQHSLKIQEISTHAGIYISELLNKQMQGAILKDRLREID